MLPDLINVTVSFDKHAGRKFRNFKSSEKKHFHLQGQTEPTTWALVLLSTSVVGLCVFQFGEIKVELGGKEFILVDDVSLSCRDVLWNVEGKSLWTT